MRCEHCGRNEATFHYQSTVNGYTEEVHLCADCAAELGYREGFAFSLLPSLFGGFGGFFGEPVLTPVARRALPITPVSDEPRYEVESLLGEAEGRSLRRERERNSLQVRLREAVDAEDYEQAARLRDELRRLDERS